MSYAPNRTTESTLRDRDSYLSKAQFSLRASQSISLKVVVVVVLLVVVSVVILCKNVSNKYLTGRWRI